MIILFKYYADMENYENFKSFDYIYIYILWLADLDKDSCLLIRNLRFMSCLFQKLVSVSLDSTECMFQLHLAFFWDSRHYSWDH